MNEETFLEKVSEVSGVPVDQLTDATEIDPANWESIQLLDVIAAMDESYGVTVPAQSLTACKSLGELRDLIRSAAK